MSRKKQSEASACPTISACMIVKNEQDMLPRCLASIRDVMDEIIVVDTGSTDRTVEIAEKFGCRVYHFPWTGDFSAARNESLKHAVSDWIFVIDADEELPGEESNKIRQVIDTSNADILSLTVINKSLDTDKVSSVLPSVRLFRRKLGLRYEGIVHNRLSLPQDVSVQRSEVSLYHYGYDLNQGRLEEKRRRSCELLEQQLAKNPHDVFANFNMAQLLIGLRGTEDPQTCERIVDHARRVIEHADPKQTGHTGYRLMAHHHLAVAMSALSRYDEAKQYCLSVLAEKEDYIDAILTLANIYLALADFENARAAYERFLAAVDVYRPEEEEHDIIMHYLHGRHIARYGLGTIYRLQGRIDDALREYHTVLRDHPSYLDTGYQVGVLHMQRGEPARAEDILKQVIEHDPDSVPTLIALARAIKLQGRGDRAVAYLESALVKAPGDPDVTLALATTLIRLGKIAEGTSRLEAVLAANPADSGTAFAVAGIYFELENYNRAGMLYRLSLEHKPMWSEAYTNLGNCFFRQKRYKEARAAYETALALAPGSQLSCRNLALTYVRESNYEGAIAALEQYIDMNRDTADMYRLLGDMYSLSGEYTEAIHQYERHLSAHPNDCDCLYQIAEAYRKTGHSESAAAGYRYLLKINPDHDGAKKRLHSLKKAASVR